MIGKITLKKLWPSFLLAGVLLPLLFVSAPAAATPAQVADPVKFQVDEITTLRISSSPAAPHDGEQIAVWDPDATPVFSVGCNLPGASGGIKWELRADTDGDGDYSDSPGSARVMYNIPGPAGANAISFEFGDGGTVTITLTGTATVTPSGGGVTYAWVDVSLVGPDADGTENTSETGQYKFASCGREGPTTAIRARYVGTTTFEVERECKWCNKGAVLSQVTQNLGNCCAIPDIIVDVRQGTFDDSEHDNDCTTVDPDKVGTADPATCLIQSAIDYINDMTNWSTEDPTPGDGENFIGVTAQDCTDTVCEQNNSKGVCENCANNTATDPARPPNGDGFERFVVTNPYEDVRLNIFACSIDIFEPNDLLAANSISPVVTMKDSVGKVTILDIHVHGSSVGYLIEDNDDLVIVKNSRAIGGVNGDAVGALVNGDTIGYLINDNPGGVEITGSPEISGWDIGIQINGNDVELRTNNDIKNNGIGIQITGDMNETDGNDVGKEGEPNGIGIQVTSTGENNDLHGDNVSHNTGDGIQIMGNDNMVEDEDTQENGEDGIDVSGNGNEIIKNKQIKMNGGDGIEVSGGTQAKPNELEENVTEDNVGNGINVTGNSYNMLKKNEAEDNGENGIEVSGDNNTLEENETHNNDKNGVKVTGDNNQLTKNDSNDNGEHGMLADGEVAPNPTGNKFDENDADDNVKQGIRACGQIDQGGNTGSGNGEDPQVDFACLDIDLSVGKTDSPDPVTGGNELTYTLTVSNTLGTDQATGVKVVDELPNDVTFNSAVGTGGFTCSHSSGTVTCTGGTINAGSSVTITIKVQISDDGLCGDTITNTAEVDPDDDIFESNENNNEIGNVTTVVNCANLTVDASGSGKTDSPDPIAGGGAQLTYTIVIKNTGAGNAASIKVVDTLPSGTTFVAASFTTTNGFSCSHSSGVITCTGGSINSGGATATITYKVTITSVSRCGNNIQNDVSVDPDDTILETNENDNEDNTQTSVDCADLDVTFNDETSGQDLVLASGFTSKARYTLANNGETNIATVTFPGTMGGTATRNTPTVAFSGDSAGWSCGTLNTTTWSCSGPLAAGDSVNIVFTVTGAAQTAPKTVTYTPGASTCTNTGPCTDNVASFANDDGNDITPATDTDNLT